MTAAALLAQLSGLGVSAWADGAVLRFKPASLVPPAVLADLRAHKAEVMALLTAPVVPAVAVAPPQTILGLFPADRGYLAREPVRDASASAPSDGVGVPDGFADEGEAGTPRRYPSAVVGLLRASQCRPVSWADAAARPSPGSWCRNCEYGRWWGNASGWRCWACHPPSGLAATDIEEVGT